MIVLVHPRYRVVFFFEKVFLHAGLVEKRYDPVVEVHAEFREIESAVRAFHISARKDELRFPGEIFFETRAEILLETRVINASEIERYGHELSHGARYGEVVNILNRKRSALERFFVPVHLFLRGAEVVCQVFEIERLRPEPDAQVRHAFDYAFGQVIARSKVARDLAERVLAVAAFVSGLEQLLFQEFALGVRFFESDVFGMRHDLGALVPGTVEGDEFGIERKHVRERGLDVFEILAVHAVHEVDVEPGETRRADVFGRRDIPADAGSEASDEFQYPGVHGLYAHADAADAHVEVRLHFFRFVRGDFGRGLDGNDDVA